LAVSVIIWDFLFLFVRLIVPQAISVSLVVPVQNFPRLTLAISSFAIGSRSTISITATIALSLSS
jgi:hypothetical protein